MFGVALSRLRSQIPDVRNCEPFPPEARMRLTSRPFRLKNPSFFATNAGVKSVAAFA
jgi:hypothetical protein